MPESRPLRIQEWSAVILDNDGIILDSEPINFEAARRVFEKYGIPLRPADIQDGIGAGAKYMGDPKEKYGLKNVTVEQLMMEREEWFQKLAKGRLAPFVGLDCLIDHLRKIGTKVAVASSASTEVILNNFKIAALDPNTFDVIVNSSKILHKKPAPDIFLQAARDLGVSPSHCLVVEDSPAGIVAAIRAGMRVVAVASTFPKVRLYQADFLVDDLKELVVIIKSGDQQSGDNDDPLDLALIKSSGFDDEELATLSVAELRAVQRSVRDGLAVNSTFKRANYYPLPRDLSFPAEKPLFTRWAADKTSIVEIGVFEGASAVIFRRAMSSNGTLHLIDPYVVVPDSGLTARPWMAKLNLMRSQNGTVKWHRDYSDNVARWWSQSIDLLFIDGDHSYKGTKSDWDKWRGHVVEGGIVMFHDARMGKPDTGGWDGWPGPTRVVDELFRGDNKLQNWDIVEETGSLVVVQRVR